MEENERVRIVMKYLALEGKYKEFSDKIGMSKQAVYDVCLNKHKAGAGMLQKIQKAFPFFSTDWIMKGVGEAIKIKSDESQEPSYTYTRLYDINMLVQKVIEIYEKVQNLELRIGKLESKDGDEGVKD
jgi:predicted DNA-binding protein YlxM (UPF0122 family)